MESKLNVKPKIKELKTKKVIYVNSIGDYGGQGTEDAWETVCGFAEKQRLFGRATEFIGISHDDRNEKFCLAYSWGCQFWSSPACISLAKSQWLIWTGSLACKTYTRTTYSVAMSL